MLKVNVELKSLIYFLDVKESRKYIDFGTGIVLFTNECTDQHIGTIVSIIEKFKVSATLEYTRDKDKYNNLFKDVYIDGRLRESNSLIHVYTEEDIAEYFDGESSSTSEM